MMNVQNLISGPLATGKAVEELYYEYRPIILSHIIRIIQDYDLAEDLCQETFMKALCAWSEHDPEANPVAWLYRIATNTAYDYLRRCRRIHFTSLIENAAPHSTHTMEKQVDEGELIKNTLARLPYHYRNALLLTSQGCNTLELAAALGCSPNTARTRLFRARKHFRRIYHEC